MMIEDGIALETPVENLESLKEGLLKALDEGMGKCSDAISELDRKVVKKLGDLELRLKVIQHCVATQGQATQGGTPTTGLFMNDLPTVVSPFADRQEKLDEAAAAEVANQLMQMGNVKEKENAEKERKDTADAEERLKEAEEEKKKKEAEEESKQKKAEEQTNNKKKAEEDKNKQKKAEEEKKTKKKKAGEEKKAAEAGVEEVLGKRKNERESDSDDEERKKRIKMDRLKKNLGDVETVPTGTKRNRD